MEPTNRVHARTGVPSHPERRRVSGRRSRVVIADSGAEAEILVLPPGEPLDRGAVFRHHGATWVVTGMRRDSGVLVAEPASQ